MNRSPDLVVKASGWLEEDRIGFWLARSPEERVHAVGVINLTTEEPVVGQRLQKVVVRGINAF